jgi:cation transport ATPase
MGGSTDRQPRHWTVLQPMPAPVQKAADRMAGYLVYFALVCAALTFLLTRDARSVIIVAGACGIAAGTPLAVLGPSDAPPLWV